MNLPALVALMVLAHTAFAGGRVALTLAAIRLGGTPLEVGLVVSLLALVPMCLAVHAGRWSDRSGAVRPPWPRWPCSAPGCCWPRFRRWPAWA